MLNKVVFPGYLNLDLMFNQFSSLGVSVIWKNYYFELFPSLVFFLCYWI